MKFKEWFESQNKCHKSLYGFDILDKEKWIMGEAWEACKNEIIKLMQDKDKNFNWFKSEIPIIDEIIEKIEKL